jgi:hypothetical protein
VIDFKPAGTLIVAATFAVVPTVAVTLVAVTVGAGLTASSDLHDCISETDVKDNINARTFNDFIFEMFD